LLIWSGIQVQKIDQDADSLEDNPDTSLPLVAPMASISHPLVSAFVTAALRYVG